MTIRALVLDFDGTFTDVEAEAAPFVGEFRRDVFDLLGRDASAEWEAEVAEVAAHPGRYGWEQGGRIVAPAAADPYIHTTTVAQRVLSRAGVLCNTETRGAIIQALYHKAYHHTHTAFRPDAREVLEAVVARDLAVFVVTNARTDAVLRKLGALVGTDRLDALLQTGKLTIVGDARKFVLAEPSSADPRFDALVEHTAVPSLDRPVLVRRGPYFDALRGVFAATGASPAELLVCGDIFELDLALPAALGAHVHLVTRPGHPPYEREAIAALGARGGVSFELSSLLARLAA